MKSVKAQIGGGVSVCVGGPAEFCGLMVDAVTQQLLPG